MNRRKFPRRKLNRSFYLMVSGEMRPALITDISPAGLGIIIKDSSELHSDTINLDISEIDLNCKAQVVWKRKSVSEVRLGVARKDPIKGSLSTYGFSDVVIGLQRSKNTGTLNISTAGCDRKVFFNEGEIVYASSDMPHEQLGNILAASGVITEQQKTQLLAETKNSSKSEGAALVKMGFLTPQQLLISVNQQVEKIILNLCSASSSEFVFTEGPLPKDEVIIMRLNAANLIYHGYKNSSNFDNIKAHILNHNSIISLADPSTTMTGKLSLKENDRQILSIIRGWITVKDILSQSRLSTEDTLRILYGLSNIQAINIETVTDPTSNTGGVVADEETDDPVAVEKIERLFDAYKTMGYLGILGLAPNPTASEIKRAYYDKAKEYHPDRFQHIRSESLKEKLNIIFAYISEAYRELSKNIGNTATITTDTRHNSVETTDKKTLARAKYAQGREMAAARDYEQAMTFFGQAVYLDSSVPDYHYYYGLTLLKNSKFKDAETSIRKAIKLSPMNSRYITELGQIYLKLGFKTRAKNSFEQALRIDPSNMSAAEGLKKSIELS